MQRQRFVSVGIVQMTLVTSETKSRPECQDLGSIDPQDWV